MRRPGKFCQVIGISGPSGAGKTTLARRLSVHLDDAVVLSLDSYYETDDDTPETANFCDLTFLRVDSFIQDALTLASGVAVEIDEIDSATFLPTGHRRRVDPRAWLVLEGMVLFRIPEIASLCDLRLYLSPTIKAIRVRKFHRDATERGRSAESTQAQLRWVESEYAHDLATLDPRVAVVDAAGSVGEVWEPIWAEIVRHCEHVPAPQQP